MRRVEALSAVAKAKNLSFDGAAVRNRNIAFYRRFCVDLLHGADVHSGHVVAAGRGHPVLGCGCVQCSVCLPAFDALYDDSAQLACTKLVVRHRRFQSDTVRISQPPQLIAAQSNRTSGSTSRTGDAQHLFLCPMCMCVCKKSEGFFACAQKNSLLFLPFRRNIYYVGMRFSEKHIHAESTNSFFTRPSTTASDSSSH